MRTAHGSKEHLQTRTMTSNHMRSCILTDGGIDQDQCHGEEAGICSLKGSGSSFGAYYY